VNKKEKRKYPRIEAKVHVTFRTLEDLAAEYTKNISKGGIFLKTDQLLDPNAEITLTMTFPGGIGTFLVQGKVTRLVSMSHPTEPGKHLYGAGIKFVNPNREMLKAIESFMGS
jgi:type IV pilus assembly protein PilZ